MDSVRYGLHYGAATAGGNFTRDVYTIAGDPGPNVWVVPVGVNSIDVLLVGGGGMSQPSVDGAVGALFLGMGGGGGGGIVVSNALATVPGETLRFSVGVGNGGNSYAANDTLGGIIIAGPAGGGGNTALDAFNPGQNGAPSNGSGAGGVYDFITDTLLAATVGDGTGGDGGDGANSGAGNDIESAGGGGGGAGGNGVAAVVGAPGNPGVGGPGGAGAVPAPSTFGPWGADIGEGGFFGGGGGGRNYGDAGTGLNWTVAARGIGGGAANTGGGGIPPALNADQGQPGNGFSGIIVVIYATP